MGLPERIEKKSTEELREMVRKGGEDAVLASKALEFEAVGKALSKSNESRKDKPLGMSLDFDKDEFLPKF